MSMMWDDDNKKTALTILSKRKPDGERVSAAPMRAEVVKDEDGIPDGRHLAAQDMMAAFHEKSPQKLSEAMANWMDIHNSKSKDESSSD